ncbi:hypothetical protein N8273_00565 [Algibacter sp.]|nr:hypothetical protein [Algibacter sp.]
MTTKEFNSRIESLKTSINNGNFDITPEFVKKLADVKNEMQQDTVNKNVTPIITIDSWAVLSRADRRKMKNIIKLKI